MSYFIYLSSGSYAFKRKNPPIDINAPPTYGGLLLMPMISDSVKTLGSKALSERIPSNCCKYIFSILRKPVKYLSIIYSRYI